MMMVASEILGLADRNKEVTFMADGAETMGEVSGSRTAVTVDGAAAERGDLAEGMLCDFGYKAAEEIEFKTVACITLMRVSSEILGLADRNKEVTFTADGAEVMGEVSGSRTSVMVDGSAAKRGDLAEGMMCDFSYAPGGEIEFKTVACRSN